MLHFQLLANIKPSFSETRVFDICKFDPASHFNRSLAGRHRDWLKSQWVDGTARALQGFSFLLNFHKYSLLFIYPNDFKEIDFMTQEMANDKESVISDSYGESYDQSPDAHDYYGR